MSPHRDRIVISEFMDDDAVDSLRQRFDVDYDPSLVDNRADLLARLDGAKALIVRNRTQVDAELLVAARSLKVVGRLGVGLDNIDLGGCAAQGVAVAPATGANALAVAEYVIAMAMVLLRGAYLSTPEMADGGWPRAALGQGRESAGKVLGLVGFGGIGRVTAGLAKALSMRVIACDSMLAADDPVWAETGVARRDLDGVLAEADVVSLHVPLTSETRGLIDGPRLERMKAGAVLIDTARGGVVDEAALAASLRSGRLAGAALDVFETEPLAAGSCLAGMPNLILTPHIGGVTRESNVRVSTLVADKVATLLTTD